MSDLPPDPARLRAILTHLERQLADTETIRIYLRLQRDAVQQALAAAETQTVSRQQERPALEAPPQRQADGYKMEKNLRDGHPLGAAIHLADCTMTQRDTQPISADDARLALTKDKTFFRACEFCRPDTKLGMPG